MSFIQTQVINENDFFETGLTKKQRRALRKKKTVSNTGLNLKTVNPKTRNQSRVFNEYDKGNHLLLHGVAGTGKTFISFYLGLKEILETERKNKLVVVRSIVPTRDMGFLPGNQKEKAKVYEGPYYNICTELFGRGDAYDCLKNKGTIEFISTSFIRGITLSDCIVVVDECQNLTFHELDSIITRLGDNCKIMFCGDFRQTDLKQNEDKRGLLKFMNILKSIRGFSSVEFEEDDIVRSQLVKSYIIAKLDNGIYT